jgi:hypothetical protein
VILPQPRVACGSTAAGRRCLNPAGDAEWTAELDRPRVRDRPRLHEALCTCGYGKPSSWPATNLRFYLAYTCFWALVWRSETRPALAARAVVVAAATLSDQLTLLFTPLVVHRTLVRRARSAFVIPFVFASGLAVQFAAMVSSGPGWQESLAAARARCDRTGGEARVPVAPGPFGFALEMTCVRLR